MLHQCGMCIRKENAMSALEISWGIEEGRLVSDWVETRGEKERETTVINLLAPMTSKLLPRDSISSVVDYPATTSHFTRPAQDQGCREMEIPRKQR